MASPDRTLERFLEAVPDAALVLTPDGTVAQTNAAAASLFGHPPGALSGRHHHILVQPEDRVHTQRELEWILGQPERHATPHSRELRGLRADGRQFPSQWFWSPLRGERDLHALTVVRDLSAQRTSRAEAARYQALFESTTDGLLVLDMEGNLVDCNQAACARLGYSPEEMLRLNIQDINAPDFASQMPARIARVSSDGADLFEAVHLRKDGSRLPVEVNARRTQYRGQPVFFSIIRDITERKKNEELLRQSGERLSLLLQAGEALAQSLDLNTVLQTLTEVAAQLFGVGSAAVYLLEGEVLMLGATHPPLPSDFPAQLRRAPVADHPHIQEAITDATPVILPDLKAADLTAAERAVAEIRNLRTTVFIPLPGRRRCTGVLTVASTDAPCAISEGQLSLGRSLASQASIAIQNAQLYQAAQDELAERKRADEEKNRLQAQLLQSHKMESVGRLAGGVAHDFNNMLSVILGNTEMALMRLDPDHPAVSRLQQIQRAADRSADLTRQLLAFARKQTVAPRVLDLNETVGGLLQMLARLVGEHIELAWRPAEQAGAVKMDPSQLDQILANLCVNARDAIRDTGKVTIETGAVAFDEAYCRHHPGSLPGEYVLLAVSDSGCGMDADTIAHLFEPFFTTKEVGQGTGLGLATVYGIVRQNGGFINVYSKLGRGTTFRIYLPRCQPQAEQPVAGTELEVLPPGVETILVVEDEPGILGMTADMLQQHGYTVLSGTHPNEALRLGREHAGPIHLLVTDVILPEMNGRVLAQRLAELHPQIRCLFISGYTANVIAHHGVLDEEVDFLQKPFSLADLVRRVRAALDR